VLASIHSKTGEELQVSPDSPTAVCVCLVMCVMTSDLEE
jgi:hypothetical protein